VVLAPQADWDGLTAALLARSVSSLDTPSVRPFQAQRRPTSSGSHLEGGNCSCAWRQDVVVCGEGHETRFGPTDLVAGAISQRRYTPPIHGNSTNSASASKQCAHHQPGL